MIYCNDLLTLSVLSLYEGELLGKVEKLYFDKKIKKLICIELIGSNGERYLLSSKNIYNIGKNAITVKNNEAVTLKVEDVDLCPSPIGSKAYTICGEYLGIITELSLNEKYLTQKFSFDNNSTVEIDKLASSGRNTTIFYDNQKKIDISKFIPEKSPKSFKTENIIEAQILPVEESNETKPTEPKNLSLQKPLI